MKTRVISVILSAVLLFSLANTAFAAELGDVKTDLPNISANVKLGENEKLDSSAIKATLDGQKLNFKPEKADGSTEWIVLIDTSMSTNTYFEAEKDSLVSVVNSLGEKDSLKLYSFQETIIPVLKGNESKEDAIKKINALKCNGQDTVFYSAVKTLMNDVNNSKADKCVPVIISDGKDTESPKDKDAAVKALKNSKVPVNGFFADSLDKKTAEQFDSFLKNSGGSASAFSTANAVEKISKSSDNKNVVLNFEAPDSVKANDKAVFAIDLGSGNEIKKEISVKEWESPSEKTTAKEDTTAGNKQSTEKATASAAETTAKANEPAGEKESFDFSKLAIPAAVVLVLALVAFLILRKKKKPADEKPAKEPKPEKIKKEKAENPVKEPKPEKVKKEKPEKQKVEKPAEKIKEIKTEKLAEIKEEKPIISAAAAEVKEAADKASADAQKAEKALKLEQEKKEKELRKEEEKKLSEDLKKAKEFEKAAKKKEAEKEKILKNKKAEAEKKAKEAKKVEDKKKAEEEKKAKKQKKIDDKKKLVAEKKAQQFQFYFEEKDEKKGDNGKKR